MPSPSELKKRPPPIKVPPPPMPLLTPGPNAFAIAAAKAKQDEMAKQSKREPDERRAASPLRRQPRNSEDLRGDFKFPDVRASNQTTVSQLMDAARPSPQKPVSRASSDSRHTKSSGRSKRSQRSNLTAGSATQEANEAGKNGPGAPSSALKRRQILAWEDEAAITRDSVRARIEDKADSKASKIMGQTGHIRQGGKIPTTIRKLTALTAADSDGTNQPVLAGRYTDVSLLVDKAPEPLKSPKKKIFGMHIPRPSGIGININFGRSAQATPAPENMPAKAAEVLGAGMERPNMGRRNTPSQPWRPAPRAPRADMTKSLPTKGNASDPALADQWGRRHDSLPSHRKNRSLAKDAPQVPTLKPEASFDFGAPPTPPRKDTPKETKVQVLNNGEGQIQEAESDDPSSPTPAKGAQESDSIPAKKDALAPEYAKLVNAPSIMSACVEIENFAFELEGDSMHPGFEVKGGELQKRYPEWQTTEQQAQRTSAGSNSDALILQPRFYSPSIFSSKFEGEGGRPSHNVSPSLLPSRPLAITCPGAFLQLHLDLSQGLSHPPHFHLLSITFTRFHRIFSAYSSSTLR